MKKNGFTLAEVLIVLIILGVVAAMTVPSLLGNANQTAFITGFQKGYTNLLHAYNVSSLEVALPLRSASAENVAKTGFAPYFKTLKTFTNGFQAQDGIAYYFKKTDGQANCGQVGTDLKTYDPANACFYVLIDVNGPKGPNTLTTSNVRKEASDRYVVFLNTDSVTTGPYATAAIMANIFSGGSDDQYANFAANKMFATGASGDAIKTFNVDTAITAADHTAFDTAMGIKQKS